MTELSPVLKRRDVLAISLALPATGQVLAPQESTHTSSLHREGLP